MNLQDYNYVKVKASMSKLVNCICSELSLGIYFSFILDGRNQPIMHIQTFIYHNLILIL